MRIGLLLPSRERINLKLTVISSIMTTVDDINNVTLYLGIDEDDPTRDTAYKIAQAVPWVKIVDFPKTPSNEINIHKLWNECYRHSTEDIVAMIGDDMIFRTPSWDTAIIKEFEEGPEDHIQLVYCNDGHRGGSCPVNAFVHRDYVEQNDGIFLREEFIANWVDTWMQQVFTALGRLIYLPDYTIEHNHWIFGQRGIDNAGRRLLERNPDDKSKSDALFGPLEPVRAEEVKKFAKITGIKPDWQGAKFSQKYWNE